MTNFQICAPFSFKKPRPLTNLTLDFGPDVFDAFEHQHLDTPLNCDIDEVVPGKLQAMKSPRDLPGGAQWLDVHRQDGSFSHRDFQK